MTDEEMNVYKMRISQAGIAELTVVMFEMEMQWIKEAIEFHADNDMEKYADALSKAQSTQTELMNVMNRDNETAKDVYSIFAFVNRQLIKSRVSLKPSELFKCNELLGRLKASFEKIVPTDTEGPLMEQSEKVYAGLTYGSGGLVESSMGGKEYKV